MKKAPAPKRRLSQTPKVSNAARSTKTTKAAKIRTVRPVPLTEAPEGEVIEMVPRLLGIRQILVPLDFSESAEKALRYAVSFARQFDARITLLHVRPVPYYPPDVSGLPVITIADEPTSEKLQTHLEAESRRLIPAGMCDRSIVRMGPAYDQICAVARETKADMIIIATHGHTGLKRAFLGSTAERVVRHAPCPVLVVREHEHEFA